MVTLTSRVITRPDIHCAGLLVLWRFSQHLPAKYRWRAGLLVVNIIGNYCCTRVLFHAKMLKDTENEETRLFCHMFYNWWHFDWGGGGRTSWPYNCNFNAICDIKIFVCFFACLPLCSCQTDTNGSILYDHAKYVIFLVKVKIVLNNSCNLKL